MEDLSFLLRELVCVRARVCVRTHTHTHTCMCIMHVPCVCLSSVCIHARVCVHHVYVCVQTLLTQLSNHKKYRCMQLF